MLEAIDKAVALGSRLKWDTALTATAWVRDIVYQFVSDLLSRIIDLSIKNHLFVDAAGPWTFISPLFIAAGAKK